MTNARPRLKLSVVIVTFNSEQVLRGAMRPIAASEEYEIIVVDNASSDGTLEVVEREFPAARVIANHSNLGFAQAVNMGVGAARSPLVMLLNPDASIDVGATELLIARAEHEGTGLVAPWVQHRTQRIVSAGWLPTPWRMLTHYSGLSRLAGTRRWLQGHYLLPAQLDDETFVEWVSGACFVCRRSVWDQLEGLSERWFMYAEDIEFSHRVNVSGLKNVVVRDAVAHHTVGGSDSTGSLTGRSDWVLNLRDFYRTDLAQSPLALGLWTAIVTIGLFSRSIMFAALGLRARGDRRKEMFINARLFSKYARALLRTAKTSETARAS